MNIALLRWPTKDPADDLDYSIDWRDQLALPDTPDTIATVAWTVPADLTAGAQYHASGIATTWLSGGAAGTEYVVACRITTAAGRVIERSARLAVREL
jgi:hypothetical protein